MNIIKNVCENITHIYLINDFITINKRDAFINTLEDKNAVIHYWEKPSDIPLAKEFIDAAKESWEFWRQ